MTDDETKKLRTQCLQACLKDDADRVEEFLEAGVDINGPVDGWTSFLAACIHEPKNETAEYLVRNGAEMVEGCDSLLGPCNFGDADLLRLLLVHGADPNYANPTTGETMLHIAALRGMYDGTTDCVRLLLEAGAKPNVYNRIDVVTPSLNAGTKVIGETPLHWAAAFGSEEMIRLLVDAGADTSSTDARGDTPLTWYGRHQRRSHHLTLGPSAGRLLSREP